MSTRLVMRFRAWVMLSTLLLVVLLTAAFLSTAFRSSRQIAEEHATTRFALIAGQAAEKLDRLLHNNGKFVSAHVRGELSQFAQAGQLNARDGVATFLASLEADPTLYSHYFGLANEEFLQVIGIRADPRIATALDAPAGAWFAVRRIVRDGQGRRTEHYRFLDQDRRELGTRSAAAAYLPSSRPWYGDAVRRGGLAVTGPYIFASTGELGITVATPLPERAGVLATDISLRSLHGFLGGIALPPNGAIALQDDRGNVLAFHGYGKYFQATAPAPMAAPADIANPYLAVLRRPEHPAGSVVLALGPGEGEKFVVTRTDTDPVGGVSFRVMVLAPLADFTGSFRKAERDVLVLAAAVLLVLLPVAFLGTRRISRTLTGMAADSERLKQLDFSREPHHAATFLYEVNALGEAQHVLHDAIRRRTNELEASEQKLAELVENGIRLSREQDRTKLLRHILFSARELAHCTAATMYLRSDRNTLLFALRTNDMNLPVSELPLYTADGKPNESYVVVHAALHNRTILIDDVYSETRFDLSGTKRFSEESGLRTVSMLTVPLSPRGDEVIGVIQLINALDPATGAVIPFPRELVGFVEALASQSAVALENQNLLEAQRESMDALIRLIASAIDAKSPYTGGHCERVPQLAIMLAEAACAESSGPLAEFRFENDEEWREFRIGAWLHDCGKVTTPEYVVDKAVKLETIYNRVHEIRTRFEVLLRDARIDQLEAVAAGAEPAAALARYEARKAQLADDFAFVAECNLGGEFMAAERIERLARIAVETWQRHFDDRLGLSHAESTRRRSEPEPLPARETLLADKAHHVVPRIRDEVSDPKWGFKVEVPEHLYNYGEVYNLSVSRGTLTEEERFKINEHVMQSLMMLEQLPLPKQLRRVPEYAGTHHETLTGTGYPRRLGAADLSVPARIVAIADIFEALTASDRPYKKTKTLSECIALLAKFKQKGHIDPVLFDLFLTSGVYRRYAEQYLLPEQIDAVDVARYLG